MRAELRATLELTGAMVCANRSAWDGNGRVRVTIGLFSGRDFYAVAQNVVSTAMFPSIVGALEPPIGAGLFRVVDKDFREDLI